MFIAGIRTSTVVMAALLLASGLVLPGRRWRAMVACLAWIVGFEVTWQFTSALFHDRTLPVLATRASQVLTGAGWVAAAHFAGVRVSRRAAIATAALWLAWMATGFNSNLHSAGRLDPLAEVLNEGAKTAWGLAYLLPLVRHHNPDVLGVRRHQHLGHHLRHSPANASDG